MPTSCLLPALPVTNDTKAEQEARVLELLALHRIDLVVLARAVRAHLERRVFVEGRRTILL